VFLAYALAHLPAPPTRILEVGCGSEGGLAPALAKAGYDVLAIDPDAPKGPLFRRVTLEELDHPGPFDAAVAGRVLHHVDPLGPGLDKLARLAPLLVVDEFACDRVDDAARAWHRREYRALVAAGTPPAGPEDLDAWRAAHAGLHPYGVLRAALDRRYDERDFHWRPYLYRWMLSPDTKAREEQAIETGAIRPIGFRYVGLSRSASRASA
jgi:SAM-dependent methyltransferase